MASRRTILKQLNELGLSSSLASRAYAEFGLEATNLIGHNPYILLRLDDRSAWSTADSIARGFGLTENDPMRLAGAIQHSLRGASQDGHVYLPMEEMLQRMQRLLGWVEEEAFDDALSDLIREGDVAKSKLRNDSPSFYLKELYRAESFSARRLAEIAQAPSNMALTAPSENDLSEVEASLKVHLAPAQREAISSAMQHKVVIITGGPGTGKTTILRGVLELFQRRNARILLAAPTGRASRRLADSTGKRASTIHRMLEYNPDLRRFNRNASRPLRSDLLVVDEASMIDVELMASLLEALQPPTHLLLVGDVDQLPSVGPGSVLNDLIESKRFQTIRLTEIFRQREGSLISVNAQRINQGEMPEIDGLGIESGQDFFFIERPEPDRARETILELVVERIPRQFGLDPGRDIQVLTPMIKRPLGVEQLNGLLQERLNPADQRFRAGAFQIAVGDKVMQVKNDYTKDVFNGDIGFVARIESGRQGAVYIDFDGRQTQYEWMELENTSLAYAVTVHKSQGSEYPAVVVPLTTQHYPMLQRNLLYTAVSRGKTLVVLVGDPRALETAIRNNRIRARFTGLNIRLQRAMSDG